MSVIFDDVLVGCGSEKKCSIDLISSKGAKYGSVTVDMDNNMKILLIDQLHPSQISINQIGTFNAVEIGYPNVNKF